MIAGVPLPDWSGQDGSPDIPYAFFADAALALAQLDDAERRTEIGRYSDAFCQPRLSISEASGLYVVLRVLFDLPTNLPLSAAKVFGGWVHPSIGSDPFDLSWPVAAGDSDAHLVVEPFTSYRGKGYDGTGEYDWFTERFLPRPSAHLQALQVSHG